MAEQRNKPTIFQSVLRSINGRRKVFPNEVPGGNNITPSFPTLNAKSGVENMQQQFLDWQVHKISHDLYTRTVYYDTDRISAYQDFRAMDGTPEIAAALNILRDECLTRSERGTILNVYSENKKVKEVLKDLFGRVLSIDFNLRLWIRDLLKYGDYFVFLNIDKELGVYDFLTLPMEEVHREEGYDGRIDSVRFRWETTGDYFEEWQIAHFRLLEDSRKLPYGRSLLDSSRKLWKQLQLAEDAMLVYRITRAPERRIFFIEVGNLPDTDVKTYVQGVQNQLQKQPMVDLNSGNKQYKYDPANVTEDYYIPVRGDKSSRIETLPGACLSLDTKIELLDGRSLTLEEIIKEYSEGKQLWTYSINPNTGQIVPGEISWAGITRKNTDVVKITLDNGEEIICTPDHKFPTRFNGEKQAKDLLAGESLWSFNKQFKPVARQTSKKNNNYEMIYNHNENKWDYTHRMVANYFEHNEIVFNGLYENCDKKTIHHKDLNRFNNSPENLCFVNNKDHYEFHNETLSQWCHIGGQVYKEKFNNNEQFKKDVTERLKKATENYYRNRTDENARNHNLNISNGIKNYFENANEQEIEKRKKISTENSKKANKKFQELLKDEKFKKALYEKMGASMKIVKNTEENKKRQSDIAKKQWENESFRKIVVEKQSFKYSNSMLQFVVERLKNGLSAIEILKEINSEHSWFMTEFKSLNLNNKQMLKMKNGFTRNNLDKMMKHFGYSNWVDFKSKLECFNHKIVSVEFLEDKRDTGTLTIDKNEQYHDFHNFALSCGVFTKNSNLDAIQDIEYLQNKLFAALQVPKNYLNYAESLQGGSTLAQADLRFSRTVNSIQEAILLELRRIANIHLHFLGFRDDIDNFKLTLTNPSSQQEILKLETMKARLEVFKEMFSSEVTAPTSYTWAMENILGFSKSEIKLILKQKKVEKKLFAEIESSVETYKKIGLFDELDEKYEDPQAAALAAMGGDQEGGGEEPGGGGEGFGASSALGGGLAGGEIGGGGGGMGAPETGGEEMPAGGEAPPEEEVPVTESFRIIKKLAKSDKNYKFLIEELLFMGVEEDDENKPTTKKESSLLENNKKLNFKTKMLLESIDKTIGKVERAPKEYSNSLLESNEKAMLKSSDFFDKFDQIFNDEDLINE